MPSHAWLSKEGATLKKKQYKMGNNSKRTRSCRKDISSCKYFLETLKVSEKTYTYMREVEKKSGINKKDKKAKNVI